MNFEYEPQVLLQSLRLIHGLAHMISVLNLPPKTPINRCTRIGKGTYYLTRCGVLSHLVGVNIVDFFYQDNHYLHPMKMLISYRYIAFKCVQQHYIHKNSKKQTVDTGFIFCKVGT